MRLVLAFALLAFLVAVTDPAGAIGFGDLKKKAEKKLKEKVEKKEDEAAESAADAAESAVEGAVEGNAAEDGQAKKGPAKTGQAANGGQTPKVAAKPSGAVASVSAKFDFIPGDRTLAAQDFASLKPGPPPKAWQPRRGAAVVEESEGARWLTPKGESAVLRIPLEGPLPMKWTLELDYALASAEGASFRLAAETSQGQPCWSASWPQAGGAVSVEGGGVAASGTAPGGSTGRHRLAFAASGAALRVYLDRERVVSIPSIPQSDPPTTLVLTILAPGNRPRIAAVRLASGPASAKTRLANGSLATYGVRFEPSSDEVRPESAPIFREIAAFLASDATAKLSIMVGGEDIIEESRRADRAKKRAAAVRDVLVSQFEIAASRLIVGDMGSGGKGAAVNRKRAGSPPVVFSRL